MSDKNLLLSEENIFKRNESTREIIGYFGIGVSKFCDFFKIQPWLFYDCATGASVDPYVNNIFEKFRHIYSEFKNAGIENGRHALTTMTDNTTILYLIREANPYDSAVAQIIKEFLAQEDQRIEIDKMLHSKPRNFSGYSDTYMLMTLPGWPEDE